MNLSILGYSGMGLNPLLGVSYDGHLPSDPFLSVSKTLGVNNGGTVHLTTGDTLHSYWQQKLAEACQHLTMFFRLCGCHKSTYVAVWTFVMLVMPSVA